MKKILPLLLTLYSLPSLAQIASPNESLWSGNYSLVSGDNCKTNALIFFSHDSKLMTVKMDEQIPHEDITTPDGLNYYYAKFDSKKYKEQKQWKTYYHITYFKTSDYSESITFKKSRATSDVNNKWIISQSFTITDSGSLHVKMENRVDLPSFECLYQKN